MESKNLNKSQLDSLNKLKELLKPNKSELDAFNKLKELLKREKTFDDLKNCFDDFLKSLNGDDVEFFNKQLVGLRNKGFVRFYLTQNGRKKISKMLFELLTENINEVINEYLNEIDSKMDEIFDDMDGDSKVFIKDDELVFNSSRFVSKNDKPIKRNFYKENHFYFGDILKFGDDFLFG